MIKSITHKQFMRALKKRTDADLIVSQYNLQEAKKSKPEDFIVCQCKEPLIYGSLGLKCWRCNKPLKNK